MGYLYLFTLYCVLFFFVTCVKGADVTVIYKRLLDLTLVDSARCQCVRRRVLVVVGVSSHSAADVAASRSAGDR